MRVTETEMGEERREREEKDKDESPRNDGNRPRRRRWFSS